MVDLFGEFWTVLLGTRIPRPVHKAEAERAFKARIKSPELYARLLGALSKYWKSKRVLAGFVQDASTWIRDWEQWESDPEPAQDTKGMTRDEWATMFPGRPYGHLKGCECQRCMESRGEQNSTGSAQSVCT